MNRINRIFFARVNDPDVVFDPAQHAVEDLEVTEISFSHLVGQAASFDATLRLPQAGLLSGPRWAIVSVEIILWNGQIFILELARGTPSAIPIGLLGELVTVEFLCRKSNFSQAVDTAYAQYNSIVPESLEPEGPRRTKDYIVAEPYISPTTLQVTMDPIAGSGSPTATIFGEGAPAGESQIFGLQIDMLDTPVSRVDVKAEARFDEVKYGLKNLLATTFGLRTYTPDALIQSLRGVRLDGAYELLYSDATKTIDNTSSDVENPLKIFTSEERKDPLTCVIRGADFVEYDLYEIQNPELVTLISATQPRREFFNVTVEPDIQDVPDEDEIEDEVQILEPEKLSQSQFSVTYSRQREGGASITTINSKEVRASAFLYEDFEVPSSGRRTRQSAEKTIQALIRRGVRKAVQRAHAVELTIDLPAVVALQFSLTSRARVVDARLPGGQAVGKVVGISATFGEKDRAELTISCPVSSDATPSGDQLDGLERVSSMSADRFSSPPSFPVETNIIRDLKSGQGFDISTFANNITIRSDADTQSSTWSGTDGVDTWVEAPKIAPTEIEFDLGSLEPTDVDTLTNTSTVLDTVRVYLPEGIELGPPPQGLIPSFD